MVVVVGSSVIEGVSGVGCGAGGFVCSGGADDFNFRIIKHML